MNTFIMLKFDENKIGIPQKLRYIKMDREDVGIIPPPWRNLS